MAPPSPSVSLALRVAIALLMIDAIIELAFISSTVSWLHLTAGGTFAVNYGGSTFALIGKPSHLMVDQGHTSNGAAGTAFIVIGLGGIVALWLQSRPALAQRWFGRGLYGGWLVLQVPALLLTLGALAYVFAVTRARDGQTIDEAVAAALPDGVSYPLDSWTPQNWFAQVLRLDLADGAVRADIHSHLRVMRGWQYNLIPLFVVQLAETGLAFADWRRRRRETVYARASSEVKA